MVILVFDRFRGSTRQRDPQHIVVQFLFGRVDPGFELTHRKSEPASLGMLGAALAALGVVRRRKAAPALAMPRRRKVGLQAAQGR